MEGNGGENGEKGEIHDQEKWNTHNVKEKCEFPTISSYTVYKSIHKKTLWPQLHS